MRFYSLFILLVGILGIYTLDSSRGKLESIDEVNEITLESLIQELGGKLPQHAMDDFDPKKAELGEQLVLTGQAKKGLFKSKLISPYFTCTDCHNLVNEFSDPRKNDPADRLETAINKNIPFLPGSTLWGVYNRMSWYNGDYVKKYGDLVKKARYSLPEAIQVCAEYCAAGRPLKNWELEAIMHYFKSKELRLKDIALDNNSKLKLANVAELSERERKKMKTVIESSFVRSYPAKFLPTMPREDRKYGEGADAENGREIFNRSCMHCHENGRVTNLHLNRTSLTGQMFVKHLEDYTDESLYQIVRHGTYTMAGRNQYMPLYTKEKMSDEQLESLVAYIKKLAEK